MSVTEASSIPKRFRRYLLLLVFGFWLLLVAKCSGMVMAVVKSRILLLHV